MSTQHIETVIVGGGQAGLSTAYHLTRRGRECLVLDRNARVGDNWRQQWDTLRLYTPAKYDGLPGFPFPADPWEFPQKDQVADYLKATRPGSSSPCARTRSWTGSSPGRTAATR
jgi:putative flavoprotein involved in K+ transport